MDKLALIKVRKFLSWEKPETGWTLQHGWTSQKMKAYEVYADALTWAWLTGKDEVTREFWGGDVKPMEVTLSFRRNYAENATEEELVAVVEAFGF